jgi:NADH-quinone oxidoreductase subunit J
MTPKDILFALASVLATVSALMVVTRRNAVYSAAWMMVALFSTAVVYLLLHSTFLFVVQVLLYAGAILVLFVFVIMLLNPGADPSDVESPPGWLTPVAVVAAAALFLVLWRAVRAGDFGSAPAFSGPDNVPQAFGTPRWFGDVLYVRYIVAFEMISLLIVAAIAAVVMLGKRRLDEPDPARPERRAGAHHVEPKDGAPADPESRRAAQGDRRSMEAARH